MLSGIETAFFGLSPPVMYSLFPLRGESELKSINFESYLHESVFVKVTNKFNTVNG